MKFAVALLAAVTCLAFQEGDPAKTVAALQEKIRRNPEIESNYTDLGNILLRTQNFSEAALVLEATRKRFPDSAQAALSLGVAHYGQRRFSDAVTTFLDANKLAPDVEQPLQFLGRIWEHAGTKEAEVTERFAAFAKAYPQSYLGHFLLGKATRNEAELRRAVAIQPNSPEAHFELASVFEDQRNFQAAIAEFQQAAKLAPKNPTPHYRLFRLYSRTGAPEKAEVERALHERLTEAEKAMLNQRQAATKHMEIKVQ